MRITADEGLFPVSLDHHAPTPLDEIARMTQSQRFRRVELLMEQAHDIHREARRLHLGPKHDLVGVCVLFSGGNDSTVLAHLMSQILGVTTHAIHANTTIGIEETRQFVRDTCSAWGLPLLEKTAPITYEALVLERGFPGPGMHWKMYQRLKERCLDAARSELITNPRTERVVYVAGRRRQESQRRAKVPLWERDGSVIWESPIAFWTKLDMTTYRLMHKDVPVNEVSQKIHMSGECLCGSFAKPNEREELRFWFPEVVAEIERIESRVAAAGHAYPYNTWGHGQGGKSTKVGRLCETCEIPGAAA